MGVPFSGKKRYVALEWPLTKCPVVHERVLEKVDYYLLSWKVLDLLSNERIDSFFFFFFSSFLYAYLYCTAL